MKEGLIYVFLLLKKYKLKIKQKCWFGKKSKISGKSIFEGYNRIGKNSEVIQSELGYASYVGENCKIIRATIGKYSCIGSNVNCIIGKHPTRNFVSIHPAFYSLRKQCGLTYVEEQLFDELNLNSKYSICIGNDVWIGSAVNILEGVTIGDGAIVAAGAIVTEDVKPYSIVAGVPAKLIRMRFDDDQVEYLKSFEWWNKDKKWLKDNSKLFNDINCFIKEIL